VLGRYVIMHQYPLSLNAAHRRCRSLTDWLEISLLTYLCY